MAGKKYYAVKKGRTTGIFRSWEECKASVDGYSGAEYKGFALLEEAETYLGGAQTPVSGKALAGQKVKGQNCHVVGEDTKGNKQEDTRENREENARGNREENVRRNGEENARGSREENVRRNGEENARGSREENVRGSREENTRGNKKESRKGSKGEIPAPGTLLAYVDGSYDDSLKRYAFGCVFITSDGNVETEYGNGDNEQSLQHRNVTGEMLGAMYAVKVAMLSGFERVEICYDYQGIEKWVTGEWRSKTELTRKYALAMREWGEDIEICFTKVAAHTNVYYNELADKMAKTGLREGNGIPKVRKLGSSV